MHFSLILLSRHSFTCSISSAFVKHDISFYHVNVRKEKILSIGFDIEGGGGGGGVDTP